MQDVKQLHARDLKEGFGAVLLAIRLPRAKRSIDPRSGIERRHHVGRLVRQRAVKEAMRQAGLATVASGHRVRHARATHLLEAGSDMRTVQAWLGHQDVTTPMLDTHGLNRGGKGVRRA
jgi:integrase